MQEGLNVCTVSGQQHTLQVELPITVSDLATALTQQLDMDSGRMKLVHNGQTLDLTVQRRLNLKPGDTLLVVPQRKVHTSDRLKRAVAEAAGIDGAEPEDDPGVFRLPPGCFSWEMQLAGVLQGFRCPPLVLSWLFVVRPYRLLVFVLFLAASPLASALELGPVYILSGLLLAIFMNLGVRQEGEASAYSVFNAGVQRLPGQLDADVIDQQIRQGQM